MEVSELTTLLHRCWGAGAGMQWGVAGPVATAGCAMRRITSGEGLSSLLFPQQPSAFSAQWGNEGQFLSCNAQFVSFNWSQCPFCV